MYAHTGKRLLDIVLAGSALAVLFPPLSAVALLIWLEDSGSPLFRQQRIGRNGKLFTMLKFRSMPIDTASVPSAAGRLLQVTRIGGLIRRTNVDELPQLLNVLRGDMSVVGPRPALPRQTELARLRSELGAENERPGLTGMAQLAAYNGMPDAEKACWDAKYCRSISLPTDVGLIVRTFGYLLKKPPVY